MITYAFAIAHKYDGDGVLNIQTRIPSVHGPLSESEFRGQQVKNYTKDSDLPWYPSILLPYLPNYGDTIVVTTLDTSTSNLLVIGVMGSNGNKSST